MSTNDFDKYLKEYKGNCIILFSSLRCIPCIELKKYIIHKNINIKCFVREDNKQLFIDNKIDNLPKIIEYNSYYKKKNITGYEKIINYLKNDYIADNIDICDF